MVQFLENRANPINLFSVARLKKEFENLKKDLLRINGEWKNVQKLNYLAHYLCQRYQDESDEVAENIFNNLDVLVKDFSFHFSIIYKLIEKIKKRITDKRIQGFFEKFKKEFEYKIQIFHNEVIKHKEKPNFRVPLSYSFTNSFSFKVHTEKGVFKSDPFSDAKKIEDYLLELKNIIEE